MQHNPSIREYFEHGLTVVPCIGKNPSIAGSDYQKYAYELPSEEKINEWESKFQSFGLVVGPKSGIICLDCDSEGESELEAEILKVIPKTPVIRHGNPKRKLGARFYRGSKEIFELERSTKPFNAINVSVYIKGSFIACHSVHPKTKRPYIWKNETLTSIDLDDLPEFTLDDYQKLEELNRKFELRLGPNESSQGKLGRNNRLKEIVAAMRFRGEPEAAIIEEIFHFDKANHEPRLFTDATEGYRAMNEDEAWSFAHRFVMSITMSLLRNKETRAQVVGSLEVDRDEYRPENYMTHEHKVLPRPQGILGEVMDLMIGLSERQIYEIAMGGAVSLLAAVIGNRYQLMDTRSNVYVAGIAPTGAGKSFPYRGIQEIFEVTSGLDKLLGMGSYQSATAVVNNLVSKRVRLDLIDEASSLFRKIKEGGVWQTLTSETLCDLWSSSNKRFIAPSYAASAGEDKKADISSCYNPCVCIFASTTSEGFQGNIDQGMFASGLMPRFLFFFEDGYKPLKEDFGKLDQALLGVISEKLASILKVPLRPVSGLDVLGGPKYGALEIQLTDGAMSDLKELRVEMARMIEESDSLIHKSMLTRGIEQIKKLTMIHAVSRGLDSPIVESIDIAWARRVFYYSLHNVSLLFSEVGSSSKVESNSQMVLNMIKRSGKLSKSQIARKTQHLTKNERESILASLLEAGLIDVIQSLSPGAKRQTSAFVALHPTD